jgi:hypothetical protein
VRKKNPSFLRTGPEGSARGQWPRRCVRGRQRVRRIRRRGNSTRRPHRCLLAVAGAPLRVSRASGHTASCNCGGDCDLVGSDRGGRRPRFPSTSSAVLRSLMTVTTRRLPPQGHCQTSASNAGSSSSGQRSACSPSRSSTPLRAEVAVSGSYLPKKSQVTSVAAMMPVASAARQAHRVWRMVCTCSCRSRRPGRRRWSRCCR